LSVIPDRARRVLESAFEFGTSGVRANQAGKYQEDEHENRVQLGHQTSLVTEGRTPR
jgi:hypothetical protein